MTFRVEEWTGEHPRWQEYVSLITAEGQARPAFGEFFQPHNPRYLVALQGDTIVGFLMFIHWVIGPHDAEIPAVKLGDSELTEVKIIAFGVPKVHRRQGIGRMLQQEAIKRARELGCYQVRSVSWHTKPENHQLKLSMGFAAIPMERDEPALTFVMKL